MALEVRKFGNGVWVGNGSRSVWINSDFLDEHSTIHTTGYFAEGELIYTVEDSLKIGKKYTAHEASKRGQYKDLVVDNQGYAYQKIDEYWHSSKHDVNHVSLPDGVYTVVWGEQ